MLTKTIVCGLCLLPFAAMAEEPVTLSTPGMWGPLAANPNPYSFDAGPAGKIYVGGIVSGLGQWQNHETPGDHTAEADLSDAQVWIQKADGVLQFYVQAGAYSFPSLGVPYIRARQTNEDFFGPVPIAYIKLAPTSDFSVQVGKLYTLIGAENTFIFQNATIEHGLLWNQTNDLNRGIQVNYTHGPFSGSLALSDGFYSGSLEWLSGLITYTIDPKSSLTFIASGNISHDSTSTFSTPLALNNSQIYDVIYAYNAGPWTLSPCLQFTYVPQDVNIGLADSASTYGVSLTGKYAFNTNWSLAGRAEYIDSTGGAASPNLVYGPGSSAASLTLTPTYQQGIFFARGEASYVKAFDTTPGFAMGQTFSDTSQARLLLETGILF